MKCYGLLTSTTAVAAVTVQPRVTATENVVFIWKFLGGLNSVSDQTLDNLARRAFFGQH
jgi:hypothetical protein